MTNEEREIITQFIARVGGAPIPGQSGMGGSVPATQAKLPPVDREADGLIDQQFQRYPEARYRITQLAFVQEHALVEAQNRIRRLEWELQQAQMAAQQAQQEAAQRPQGGGGFLGGLFGGGRNQAPPPGGGWGGQRGPQQQQYYQPPPQPQYPPGYNPGVFQRQGSGFLGSALTTAAGVAGGLVLGNALMGMFSGGGSGLGAASSPWTSPAGAVDQGGWDSGGAAGADQGFADTGSWDQPADDQSWGDGGGGSWGDSGGGFGDDDTF
ncbi:MAG: DUF2076 domain-containing protein [Acetobacteraceae bacterium]